MTTPKLPREGTLLRAVYDALEAGPADCHTINRRLPREHRRIVDNEINRIAYHLVQKGLIKGKKPHRCVKQYAHIDHEFPPVEQFVQTRDTRNPSFYGPRGKR